MSLIVLANQTVSLTTTAASSIEIAGNKLDRLDTLQVLTDRIMHEDAELLRTLAKH
jgi:hypothetical protein